MKDRTNTGLVATIVVVLITLFLVGAGAIAEAEAGSGEIRTTDYGTTPTSGGAYFWRGYSFKLTQETTVTHIIGGGVKEGDQFAGAIFDANLDGSDNPTSPKSILREVTFAGDTANQVVAIANLTLQADTWYYIAQGSLSSNDYLHWYVESLDAPDLVAASFRVSHWMPDTAAPGQAHYWTAGDPGEVVVDTPPNTTPDKPALGFRYLSDATLPEVETTDDPMYGRLLDRGNAPTALYIEYGTDSALEDGTTLNLAHPGYEGDVPHVYGTTASGLDPSTTYYYRARAINDAGRVDGDIKSFTTPDPPGAPTITGIVPGNEQLSVSIEPPAEGGVGNYDYSVDGGSTWTARSPASSASPLVIPGLTNGTTYQVRVRAVDQGIVGTASDMVEGTPEELQFTLPTRLARMVRSKARHTRWSHPMEMALRSSPCRTRAIASGIGATVLALRPVLMWKSTRISLSRRVSRGERPYTPFGSPSSPQTAASCTAAVHSAKMPPFAWRPSRPPTTSFPGGTSEVIESAPMRP